MSKKVIGTTLALAAALAFAATPIASTMAATAHAGVKCMGVNSCKTVGNACKGQGSCKTAVNACKGKNACKSAGNACKGKGYVMAKSKKECAKLKKAAKKTKDM